MSKVCHDVAIEPVLQKLTGESLQYAPVNMEDEAYLDVSAPGFSGGERVFDVRVFNPTASSYRNTAVASLYRRFEREK